MTMPIVRKAAARTVQPLTTESSARLEEKGR
jgi:hypothetical protein